MPWEDDAGDCHRWTWRKQQSQWRGRNPVPAPPIPTINDAPSVGGTSVLVQDIVVPSDSCRLYRNGVVIDEEDPISNQVTFSGIAPPAVDGDVWQADARATGAVCGQGQYSRRSAGAMTTLATAASAPAPPPPPTAQAPPSKPGLFAKMKGEEPPEGT